MFCKTCCCELKRTKSKEYPGRIIYSCAICKYDFYKSFNNKIISINIIIGDISYRFDNDSWLIWYRNTNGQGPIVLLNYHHRINCSLPKIENNYIDVYDIKQKLKLLLLML